MAGNCRSEPRLVCRPLITTLELPATRLSAEITVTSPWSRASPDPARGAPSPVSEVTVLAFRTICGADSAIRLAPASGTIPLEVISLRRR